MLGEKCAEIAESHMSKESGRRATREMIYIYIYMHTDMHIYAYIHT